MSIEKRDFIVPDSDYFKSMTNLKEVYLKGSARLLGLTVPAILAGAPAAFFSDSGLSLASLLITSFYTGRKFFNNQPPDIDGINYEAVFKTELLAFRYCSTESLRWADGTVIEQGDRLILASSDMQKKPDLNSPQNLALIRAQRSLALKLLSDDISSAKLVVLDRSWEVDKTSRDIYNRQRSVSAAELFADHSYVSLGNKSTKGADIKKVNYAILTPEEIGKLNLGGDFIESFAEARDEFKDPNFENLLGMYQASTSLREKENVTAEIEKYLFIFIENYLHTYLGDPEIVKPDHYRALPRQRKYKQVKLLNKDGILSARIAFNGDARIIPLSEVFDSKGQTGKIDQESSEFRNKSKAKAAVVIYETLQKIGLDELLKEDFFNEEDFLEVISEWSMPDYDEIEAERIFHPLSYSSILRKKPWLVFPFIQPGLTYLLTFLAVTALYSAIQAGWQGLGNLGQSSSAQERMSYSPVSPSLPYHQTDWAVSNIPSKWGEVMSSAGYYLESTSAQLDNKGQWVVNEEVESEETYPSLVNLRSPSLVLGKRILTNIIGSTVFKTPIKDGTSMTAIDIKDADGRQVEFHAYKLTDGTRKIVIDRTTDLLTKPVDVKVFLQPSSKKEIKAAGQIKPIVDVSKLDERFVNMFGSLYKRSRDRSIVRSVVAEMVSIRHNYQVAPLSKGQIDSISSPDSLLNTAFHSIGCNCGLCSSELILADSLYETSSSLNAGFGYLKDLNANPASSKKSRGLNRENYHMIGIDSEGQIFDPTPTRISDDPQTKAYMELLNSEFQDSSELFTAEVRKREAIVNSAMILSVLLSLTGGYYGLDFLRSRVRIPKPSINLSKVLSYYSDETLQKAAALFATVSWRKDAVFKDSGLIFDSRQETVDFLRDNTNLERVSRFLLTRSMPEGFNFSDRIKMLFLARLPLK